MRHSLRSCVAVALTAGVLALGRPSPAETVDMVAATVDKDVVLSSELKSAIGSELKKLQQSATSRDQYEKAADELVRQALEEAINSRLLVREAKKIPQLEVTDKELDAYLEDVRKRFDTPEEFVREVNSVSGSVSEFRERRRQLIMAARMSTSKQDAFEAEVVVSEDEISAYYQEHTAEYEKPERVYLRQIFLRVQGGDAERAQARAILQSLRDEIVAGTDFADLAKLHSQDSAAAEGGAYGWQQRGDFDEPMDSAAFALPAGGLSEVIDSPTGVHLLKVDQHEQAGTASVNEVRLDIEKTLREKAAKKKYDTWLSDLRKRSRVRIFL
jgi:peptidyl-prolyl cis-trans isomerase SurA